MTEKQVDLNFDKRELRPTKIYLVKCKFCGKEQKVWTKKDFPVGIKKGCVYCGKTFCIHNNPNDSNIIKRLQ